MKEVFQKLKRCANFDHWFAKLPFPVQRALTAAAKELKFQVRVLCGNIVALLLGVAVVCIIVGKTI